MPSNERPLIPMILNTRIYCSIHRSTSNPHDMRKITEINHAGRAVLGRAILFAVNDFLHLKVCTYRSTHCLLLTVRKEPKMPGVLRAPAMRSSVSAILNFPRA